MHRQEKKTIVKFEFNNNFVLQNRISLKKNIIIKNSYLILVNLNYRKRKMHRRLKAFDIFYFSMGLWKNKIQK